MANIRGSNIKYVGKYDTRMAQANNINISLDSDAETTLTPLPQPTGGLEIDGGVAHSHPSEKTLKDDSHDTEITEIAVVNQGGDVVTEDKHDDAHSENGSAVRPKRNAKPSLKSLENRIQNDSTKLEKFWERILAVITKARDISDSVEAIQVATKEARAIFHEYEMVWLALMYFLAQANTTEAVQERGAMNSIMDNR